MTKIKIPKKSSISRLYIPVTDTYLKLEIKNTPTGKKGTIIGRWSSKK